MDPIVCRRCEVPKSPVSFPFHNRASGIRRKVCTACAAAARALTVRTKSRTPFDPNAPHSRREVAPIPAPGPTIAVDPWRFAPSRGPYQVNVRRTGTVPVAARVPVCSRECADAALAQHAPPVYRDIRHDRRSHEGHRAIPRPPLTRVSGLSRAGACASCGTRVSPRYRSPDAVMLNPTD